MAYDKLEAALVEAIRADLWTRHNPVTRWRAAAVARLRVNIRMLRALRGRRT